eukprot:GSChrysophyteH1.ASY1.ANO1.1351.1 assembled CDS
MSSVRKRSRPIEDSSFNELSSSTLDLGASGSKEQRRLALDLDELQLSNEQLVDKVRTLEEDLQHCKDKSARQLLFLEEENEKLRKTAADIKESINTSLAEVNTTASATTPKSRGLAAVGADSHKLNQRLKEMFRDRIQAFREGVYLLTGYKVDLIYDNEAGASKSKPKLRLRSMYAESPDDSLLFQWSGDRLDLIETPFARKLDARLLENLQRCNSVPLFVSAITSELFENQTFVP